MTNATLLSAILAMDAYNRGTNPALDIGNAPQIGDAIVIAQANDDETGFSATMAPATIAA